MKMEFHKNSFISLREENHVNIDKRYPEKF